MTTATKTRKAPTEAQKAAAQERRNKIRELAKVVSSMTQAEREAIAARVGIVTIEGRRLSPFNACLLVNQLETVTVVGGFQQWRAAGRQVVKGARALALWIPTGHGDEEPRSDFDGNEERDTRPAFILGNVFDVSQTEEVA